MKRLQEMISAVRRFPCGSRMGVVGAASGSVLAAVAVAAEEGLAVPVLLGDPGAIQTAAESAGVDIGPFEIVPCTDLVQAARKAIAMYKSGDLHVVMKGQIGTRDLLKAVLDKKHGVPPKGLLSFVGVCDAPGRDRLLLVTDPAINIKPDLVRKLDIIRNGIFVARRLGVEKPKVALLAPVEKLNLSMSSTVDAELITRMAEQGEFGDALVYGPLALDLAVSSRAAEIKGVTHPVAGNADILCVPDIASGNILYKSLTSLQQLPMAATLVGSTVPMVLTSRSDSDQSKFLSIALSCYLSRKQQQELGTFL